MRLPAAVAAFGFLVAAAAVAASPQPSPAPSPPGAAPAVPLTGEAVYLRAVRAMRARAQPKFVIFHEDVAVRNLTMQCSHGMLDMDLHHGDETKSFKIWLRAADGRNAGVDLASNERCDDAAFIEPIADEHRSEDLFGPRPSPSPSATPQSDSDLRLPLIAAVRADAARFYRVTLVGEEPFDGHRVYRLALAAYKDRDRYPLTGMLVDADDWLVRRVTGEISVHMVIAGAWAGFTLTLDEAGPYWVVRDEHVDVAANALMFHAKMALDVHASDFLFPDNLPGVFPSPRPTATPKA